MNPLKNHMLSGLTVLDFTRALAGPSCTRMLAEMGATIIKIEPAPAGDMTRQISKEENERSLYFIQQNMNKKSVCLNLRDPRAIPLIKKLIPQVDVVVENFKPGIIAQMGLGYDALTAIKSDIILCSISALGQTGPLATKPGYDYIAQAYAGITSMIGNPDEAPCLPLAGIGDVSTGVHAALAITSALLYHARTGKGQHLDVGLLDVYYHYHEINVHQYSASDGQIEPTRGGRHMSYICPAGIFLANGGYVLIMAFMQHWKDLCAAMQCEDLIEHVDFCDDTQRLANQAAVIELIESWLATFPDRDSAVAHLESFGVPCAPVLSVAETTSHPHLVARGTVKTVTDRIAKPFQIPGNPLRFSAVPEPTEGPAPTLGEHNREVFRDMLAASDADIEAYYESGLLTEGTV